MNDFWGYFELLSDLVIDYVENEKKLCGMLSNEINETLINQIKNLNEKIIIVIHKMNFIEKLDLNEDIKNHNFNILVMSDNKVLKYMLYFKNVYSNIINKY